MKVNVIIFFYNKKSINLLININEKIEIGNYINSISKLGFFNTTETNITHWYPPHTIEKISFEMINNDLSK